MGDFDGTCKYTMDAVYNVWFHDTELKLNRECEQGRPNAKGSAQVKFKLQC